MPEAANSSAPDGATIAEQIDALLEGTESLDALREALAIATQRKHLDQIAEVIEVEFAPRETIKGCRAKIEAFILANDTDRQTPPEPDSTLPPPNRLPGRLPAGYSGTARRLKNNKTNRVFVWTAALAKHPDMVEVE